LLFDTNLVQGFVFHLSLEEMPNDQSLSRPMKYARISPIKQFVEYDLFLLNEMVMMCTEIAIVTPPLS
jgi:hypothetical protein